MPYSTDRQNLHVKEVHIGEPSDTSVERKRGAAALGFAPEKTASGEKVYPLARTMLYLLKDMCQTIVMKLLKAFGDPSENYAVSIHLHNDVFVPSMAYMLANGLRARLVLAYINSQQDSDLLSDIDRSESDRKIRSRLEDRYKMVPDGTVADATASLLSKVERRRLNARTRLAHRAVSPSNQPTDGNEFTSPTKLLSQERVRPILEGDACIQTLTAADSKAVGGMVRVMLDEMATTVKAEPQMDQRIIPMLLRGICAYGPSEVSMVPPRDVNGYIPSLTYAPDLFRVPLVCDPDIVRLSLFDKKRALCKLLVHLSLYRGRRPPSCTQLKQIYILAQSGSGKTTLAQCIDATFATRCFTPSREATKHFTMMQFCNKRDDAIWLDDEWTPEKYRGFTTLILMSR